MSEWMIIVFVSYLIYLYMNTLKSPIEKPVTKTKPVTKKEKPAAKAVAEKKPETAATAVVAAPPKAKKAAVEKSLKPAKTVAPKADAQVSALAVSERVGLTAGSIWNFLNQNGVTLVSQLVKQLPEEEKIIQRSIGWLAQENKIELNVVENVETIALK